MSKHIEKTNASPLSTTTPENTNANPFARGMSEHANVGAVEIEQSRAVAKVQASLVIAKRFPRDEAAAWQKTMEACSRMQLAKSATYSFPRSGESISGASIRLAETLARCWGNIDYGVTELSNKGGVSEMLAWAWDTETNVRHEKTFTVEHVRDSKFGKKQLSDQRDIYEISANMGARRMRACILSLIPMELTEAALERCRQTLCGATEEPLIDRLRKMLTAFAKYGVNQQHIETRAKKKLDQFLVDDLLELIGVFNSIKDSHSKPSDWFGVKEKGENSGVDALKGAIIDEVTPE